MTTPPGTAIPQVVPPPGSRLEQLLGMREAARAAFRDAEARLKAIEAGIRADVAGACPGQVVIDIAPSADRGRPALRLRWHEGKWYVPAGTLRAKHPDVWDELRQQESGHWQLHDLGNGPG